MQLDFFPADLAGYAEKVCVSCDPDSYRDCGKNQLETGARINAIEKFGEIR